MSISSNQSADSATTALAAGAKPSRHLLWPVLIISLISLHVISCVTMALVATHDNSFAVEPDYYQKGLHYEQTIEQRRENARLGWSARLDVSNPLRGTNERNVSCTVRDREGRAVEKATVDLVAFAHLRAKKRTPLVLLPQEDGKYLATMPFDDPGRWEFRLMITRGKDTFTEVITRDFEDPSAP